MNWYRFKTGIDRYINLDNFELIIIYNDRVFFYKDSQDNEPSLEILASEFERKVDFNMMIGKLQRQLKI